MDERPAKKEMSEGLKQALYIAAAFAVATLGYYAWKFIFFRADWRDAARTIRAEYRPTDAVAIFPSWMREEVFNFEGMAAVVPKEDTYVNFHGFDRLWTVVHTKYTSGNSDKVPLRNELPVEKEIRHGAMVIRRHTLPSFNATGAFKDAKVYGVTPGGREPCERKGDGTWKCGGESWQFVGPHKVDIAGQGAECVWAHPMSSKKIEIEFPGAALKNLMILTAFADSGSGGGYVPPVKFGVYQGDKVIKEYVHPQRSGWTRNAVNFATDPALPIIVRVSTEQEGRQHFCFNIEAEK